MDDSDREVAKALYEFYLTESRSAQHYQNELAKWLLASLVLVNGGALVLLANAGKIELVQAAAPAFVVGIIFGIMCGFLGWLNASIRDLHYDEYAQPKSLKTGEIKRPKLADRREWQILWTYRLSMWAGLLSIGAFAWGAFAAL